MSWRRWEPVVLLVLAVAVPLGAAGWLAGERRAAEVGAVPVDVPHGEALASTREDRALSAERWLRVALRAPGSFRKAADWCGERREAPLPNCRNVAVADRVCEAVGSLELARWGDG